MILVFATGLLAGVGHVLLGPDHVAALAPFSVEAHERAWVVGLRWGLGHAAGIVAVALLFVSGAQLFDLALLDAAGDYLVGTVLIAVGAWGLLHRARAASAYAEARSPHDHHVHATAALSIGTLHGLVGTGSTLAVLPAAGMETFGQAALYLSGFAGGTVGAMMGVAGLLGLLAPHEHRADAYRRVYVLASLAALLLGVVWIALAVAGVDLDGG